MSALRDERTDVFDAGLRALRQEEGTLEQARALEQRLLERLGEDALAATATRGVTRLGRIWTLLGIGALLGLGALTERDRQEPVAPRAQVVVAEVAVASVAPQPPRPAAASVEPVVQPQPRAVPAPRRPRSAAPKLAVAPPAPLLEVEHGLDDELALLERSRDALGADAATALALAEQHARVYPRGRFAQEREVLAIQALLKQARDAEASARARRFLEREASSPYALRLRELLNDKPQPAQR